MLDYDAFNYIDLLKQLINSLLLVISREFGGQEVLSGAMQTTAEYLKHRDGTRGAAKKQKCSFTRGLAVPQLIILGFGENVDQQDSK